MAGLENMIKLQYLWRRVKRARWAYEEYLGLSFYRTADGILIACDDIDAIEAALDE